MLIFDEFVKSLEFDNGWLSKKGQYTRRNGFSGMKAYIWYIECLKNYYNAVD